MAGLATRRADIIDQRYSDDVSSRCQTLDCLAILSVNVVNSIDCMGAAAAAAAAVTETPPAAAATAAAKTII